MAKFDIVIRGIPMTVDVIHYSPPCSIRVTGTGYGDADPAEDEEIEYLLRDTKGFYREDFHAGLTPQDEAEILKAFKRHTHR